MNWFWMNLPKLPQCDWTFMYAQPFNEEVIFQVYHQNFPTLKTDEIFPFRDRKIIYIAIDRWPLEHEIDLALVEKEELGDCRAEIFKRKFQAFRIFTLHNRVHCGILGHFWRKSQVRFRVWISDILLDGSNQKPYRF